MNALIPKYHLKLWIRRMAAPVLRRRVRLKERPAVTIFTSSLNTKAPLQLALASMQRCTDYPNYEILVGENGSRDGSLEFLQAQTQRSDTRLRVINDGGPKQHGVWLDQMFESVTTKYWFAVDSDMWFFAKDWLADMLNVMEKDPNLFLLGAERRPATANHVEPVGGETINSGEALCSWLFCVRTSLRDFVRVPFSFTVDSQDIATRRKFCYDTGGKLISEMRCLGLRYDVMPKSFRLKYFHFCNLSWGVNAKETKTPYQAMKAHQLVHIASQVGSRESV